MPYRGTPPPLSYRQRHRLHTLTSRSAKNRNAAKQSFHHMSLGGRFIPDQPTDRGNDRPGEKTHGTGVPANALGWAMARRAGIGMVCVLIRLVVFASASFKIRSWGVRMPCVRGFCALCSRIFSVFALPFRRVCRCG
ncbi:hypothetical protein BDZ97DRAFT_1200039 [Flammula alnicola]|nr:hypothetical protein BDZ97DRAFT_1200039 [Flammula alnicola]